MRVVGVRQGAGGCVTRGKHTQRHFDKVYTEFLPGPETECNIFTVEGRKKKRSKAEIIFGHPRSAGAAGKSEHPAQTLSKHLELKRQIFPSNISPFDLFLQDQTAAKRSGSADSEFIRRTPTPLQMNANAAT